MSPEFYWLVANGAKMTGMPAFGPRHDEQGIWNIAAFVKALPGMTAAEYAGYAAGHGAESPDSRRHAP